MGAPDPLAEIRKAIGKFEACSRPEMDRIQSMCNDYRNVKDKAAKDKLSKDMQSTIKSKIMKCSKTFDSEIVKATKDVKTAAGDMKKEFDKAAKHLKGLPGNKSCLKLDVAVKGTLMTIKPSFVAK
ncbi:MAG: hypothetical protein AAFR79_05720 [Pseudomonadota bacterium]